MMYRPKNIFTRLIFQKQGYRFSKAQKIDSQELQKDQQKFKLVKKVDDHLGKQINLLKNELFRHQNYSFRILTQDYKESALNLLTQQFYDQEPLTNSYWRQFPEQKKIGKQIMFQFWSMLIQNSISNNLSVITLDLQKDETIGVFIAKDLNYIPKGFQERFMKNLNVLSSVISLEDSIIKQASQEKQKLFKQSNKVIDIFAGAIRKKHMGKKLFHKMIIGNQMLALKQNYLYAFVYATNFKTGVALSKLNYQKISEIQCKQFQFYGIKPFALIDQLNRKPTIWFKKIL